MTLNDLKQYQKLMQRRKELVEELQDAANTLKGCAVGCGSSGGGFVADPVAGAASRRERLAAAIAEIDGQLDAIKCYVERVRNDLGSGEIGELLAWHYIDGAPWAEMASVLHEKQDTLRQRCSRYVKVHSDKD